MTFERSIQATELANEHSIKLANHVFTSHVAGLSFARGFSIRHLDSLRSCYLPRLSIQMAKMNPV